MNTFLLINMANYAIASLHETEDAASEAREACGFPSHVMQLGGDWPEFTGVDLVRVYNLLPGAEEVKRFETRAVAVRRVNETIEAGIAAKKIPAIPPVPDPISTIQQETTAMAKAKKAKVKTPRRAKVSDDAVYVVLTAAGQKDKLRFNAGSVRGKVHAAIKRHNSSSGIKLDELVKNCAHIGKRTLILGCVKKLILKGYAKQTEG